MTAPVQTVTLEGGHVRLDPLGMHHLEALCAVGLDPAIWEFGTTRLTSEKDMQKYIRTALEWHVQRTAIPFAIIERTSGRVVGSTRFANIEPDHRRLEIGWTWIGRPWQRTVVNTETKYLLLKHAFETLGFLRVESKTDALNQQSRRALLRLGAVEEGTLRKHMVVQDGRSRDSVYFSILDTEWPGIRKRLEDRLARGAAAGPDPSNLP